MFQTPVTATIPPSTTTHSRSDHNRRRIPTPHAEILAVAKEILAAKGVTLDIKEFEDYVQPNNVVESGEIDANYFQHEPYLDDFNKQNNTNIVTVCYVHVEPMALYGGKQTTLDAVK